LRKKRERVFAVTDENVGWVLNAVNLFTVSLSNSHSSRFAQGEHEIEVDHSILGQTCGLLPVGIDSTILSTSGLKWNLSMSSKKRLSCPRLTCILADCPSSFEGLVSTSNHLVTEERVVWIKTSQPIWWTAELRRLSSRFVDS
jgi:thiamine pyrophosphokinase